MEIPLRSLSTLITFEGLGAIYEPYVRVKMVSPIKAVEFNGQQEQDATNAGLPWYLLVPVRFVGLIIPVRAALNQGKEYSVYISLWLPLTISVWDHCVLDLGSVMSMYFWA